MTLGRNAIRFLNNSVLSFAVNLGLTMIIRELLKAPAEVAFAIALVAVFVMNFFTLRYYVYQGELKPWIEQFTVYTGSAATFRGLEYVSFLLLHTWLGMDYRLVVIAILIVSSIVKFSWYRLVFETRPADSSKDEEGRLSKMKR
jgi:putative flippase GtrA